MENLCNICKINVPQESMSSHVQGKKHKKKEAEAENDACSIFVRGIRPHTEPELIKALFSKYDEIKSCSMGYSYAIIRFKNAETAKKLLDEECIMLNHMRLIISAKKSREQNLKSQDNEETGALQQFLDSLKQKSTFEEQLVVFESLTKFHYERFVSACSDLFKQLKVNFPNYKAYPFGSAVTTINFLASDIDIYVQIPEYEGNPKQALNAVMKALGNYAFTNKVPIRNAKVPIIKCLHKKSNLMCDISFSNKLGVCNSNLIRYYMNCDTKFRQFMLIVKAWAVYAEVKTTHYFTSYCLLMLVIYYLQQPPFFLYSVKTVQQAAEFHDGWNSGFKELPFFNQMVVKTDVKQLLIGFFKFYATFDFQTNIISPFLGRALPKWLFYNNIPEDFTLYRTKKQDEVFNYQTFLSVQDPFVHSRNISYIMNKSFVCNFAKKCEFAADVLSTDKPLHCLFIEHPKISYPIMKMVFNIVEFTVEMNVVLNYICKRCWQKNDRLPTYEEFANEWFITFCEFLRNYLKDSYRFSSVEDSTRATELTYHYTTNVNVLISRNQIKKDFKMPKLGILEQESFITEKVVSFTKQDKITEVLMEVVVSIEPVLHPIGAKVKIENITDKQGYFSAFKDKLFSQLSDVFISYEKELNSADETVKNETTEQDKVEEHHMVVE